jgi:polysaccharide export outer membrane protein
VIVFPGGGGDAKIVPLENTNTTLMEALASAGGLNKRGNAHKVKVFRKVPGAPREVYNFDMSDIENLRYADLTMQADDIVYVQPNPEIARELLADLNPFIALLTSTVLVIGIVRGFSQ